MAETTIAIMNVNGTKVRVYANGTTIWVSAGLEKATDPLTWTRIGIDEVHQLNVINLANTTFAQNMVRDNEELKEKVKVLTEQRNKAKMAEELKREEEPPAPTTLVEKVKAAVDILKS